jgi:exodeoxyribonuclease VII small subunit
VTKADHNFDFESALGELEALVQRMEAGDLTLEESLSAFERGIALSKQCQSALSAAELRVKALTEGEAGPTLSDLENEGTEDPNGR